MWALDPNLDSSALTRRRSAGAVGAWAAESKEFAEAVQTINSIIEEDDIRLARLRAETAAAKVRKVR